MMHHLETNNGTDLHQMCFSIRSSVIFCGYFGLCGVDCGSFLGVASVKMSKVGKRRVHICDIF